MVETEKVEEQIGEVLGLEIAGSESSRRAFFKRSAR